MFTFLPQCTVHDMRISQLGVPVYSSMVKFVSAKVTRAFLHGLEEKLIGIIRT